MLAQAQRFQDLRPMTPLLVFWRQKYAWCLLPYHMRRPSQRSRATKLSGIFAIQTGQGRPFAILQPLDTSAAALAASIGSDTSKSLGFSLTQV